MKTYQFKVPDDWDVERCFKKCTGKKIVLQRAVDHGVFEILTTDINVVDDEGEPSDKHN